MGTGFDLIWGPFGHLTVFWGVFVVLDGGANTVPRIETWLKTVQFTAR